MSITEFFNLFLIISALQGIVFFVYIILSSKNHIKSILYITFLVLIFALNNLQSWCIAKEFSPLIKAYQIPWHFLIAPVFYQFLIHYLDIKQKSRKLFEFCFGVFFVLLIGKIYFNNFIQDNENEILLLEQYITYEELFSFVTSISIFFYAFHVLSKKENLFIKILSYDDLRWIYTFFKLGLFCYIIWIIAIIVTITLQFTDFIYAFYPLRIFTTILIYWIGYQAINQQRIVSERKKIRATSQRKNVLTKTETLSNNEFEKIQTVLIENNLYTEPKLSVELLSEKVKMSSSKVSTLIKQETNKNFSDFINEYRVEFVKEMLKNPDYKNYTVTSIGLEAGFNSKSSFYAVFKKHEDCTPSQFQKRQYS